MSQRSTVPGAVAALLSFRGRASRRAYWTYAAVEATFWLLVAVLIDWFDLDLFDKEKSALAIAAILAVVFSLGAGVVIGVKRLHDTDRSGWHLLIFLLPVIGWLAAVTMLNAPGTPGPNRFGPEP